MEERQHELSTLRIPSGIKLKSEIFSGFGYAELIEAGMISLTACGLSFLASLFHGNLATLVVCCLVSVTASVGMTSKDKYNQSLTDQLKNLIEYGRTQRVYPYQYMREWVD